MFVSVGQGGNQLAACFWQRAHQHRADHAQREQATAATRHRTTPASSSSLASTSARSQGHDGVRSASSMPPPWSPLFALDGYAHGICLDAEPKVVGQLARAAQPNTTEADQHKTDARATIRAGAPSAKRPPDARESDPATRLFRPSNLFSEQYGRGNNWAMGYVGRQGDEGAPGSLLHDTMEAVRREAERMEVFTTIVMMHSIAGGTGSGLGSRVTEEIREQYSKQFILSCCIAPFGAGDTPLQHYNALLCLSHLYPVVDGLILASNADMARALASHALRTPGTAGAAAPAMSFAGINTYLSACLADILAPTKLVATFKQQEQEERARMQLASASHVAVSAQAATASSPPSSSPSLLATPSLHELISNVVPLPAYKLMEIWSSAGLGGSASVAHMDPRAQWQPNWKSCMDALKRFVPPDDGEQSHSTIGYSVFARGDSAVDPVSSCCEQLTTRFQKLFPHVSWNPYPLDLIATPLPRMAWRNPQPLSSLAALKQDKPPPVESTRSLAVCVNRARTASTLTPVVAKARVLLRNKAYVHWYTRYGVEASELTDAFDSIDTVIQDYRHCNTS